jgi:transcriptional regulator with XRE-family HTH domain
MSRKLREPDKSRYSGRLGARIRDLRLAKKWTQTELVNALAAKGIHTTVSVISGWEIGDRQPPWDDLPTLAAVLAVSPRGLLPPK